MTNSREPNRLIYEKSPYLLQHAYNPVDWYPWRNEAFEMALSKYLPIIFNRIFSLPLVASTISTVAYKY